jgi:hypothetical protein
MPINKERTLAYLEQEWGTYVERFYRLPKETGEQRIRQQGYDRLRDMLAHILAWWQEGLTIIRATAEGRETPRKQYDFDAFNAQAVAAYQNWDEAQFMAHFEESRRKMADELRSMNEAVFENRRVRAWLRAVIYHHAREHLVTLSRFLVLDVLENEWAEYIPAFQRLNEEQKRDFLSKQGFATFHDLLAHIIGWWEEGARVITGILDSPSFTWQPPDTDAFNRALIQKYAAWSDDMLFRHYETVRHGLLELVADLPEDAFLNQDIEGWLKDDVIHHYDDHPLPV